MNAVQRPRRDGMTMLEVLMAMVVLTLLAVAAGGVLTALARQGELNREMSVANAEVSNALSLVHAATFDTIPASLAADGYVPIGGHAYRKDLTPAPLDMPGGYIDVSLRGATGIPLPDPLTIDVVVTWDCPPVGAQSRAYVTVRTR